MNLSDAGTASRQESRVTRNNHDTISMIALDSDGNIAAGSSTNGANHKVSQLMLCWVYGSPTPGAPLLVITCLENSVASASKLKDFLPSGGVLPNRFLGA